MFNTFGNLEVDSRAGILLPDFKRGQALAITGKAVVDYENQGRNRRTTFTVNTWCQIPLPITESMRELSPFNP